MNAKWWISLSLVTVGLACGIAQADGGAADRFQQSYDSEAAGKTADALAAMDALPAPEQAGYVAQLRRGWLLYRLGRTADSVDAYVRAIALEPRSVEARVGVLLPVMALRRWPDVEAGAREVLKLDPGNYLANLRLAFAVYNQARYAEAAGIYKQLAESYPSDVDVRAGLGWSCLKMGKGSEAAAAFRTVLDIAPRNVLANDGMKALGAGR